jgi:hypothetical protein
MLSIWFITEASNSWFYSIIGSLAGAFLSGIFAISVFLAGKWSEKKKEKKKEIDRVKVIEDLITVQIHAIQIPLRTQVEAIIAFLRVIRVDKEQDMELKMVSSFNPNELIFIKKDELYNAFVHKREGEISAKHKLFSDYRNSILFLIDSKKAIKTWATDFNDKYQKCVGDYKEHLELVMRSLDVFGIEAEERHTKIGEDKFLEATDEIIKKLQEIENFQDIHVTYKHLILPLHKTCQNKSIVVGDKRVNQILSDIMSAMYCYENYENVRNTYYSLFFDLARKMNSSNRTLSLSFYSLMKNKIAK